jgi:type III secretory pathway component EscV
MQNLKHIGRIKKTGRKCLVAFRTLPGDAFNCLVVPTENLDGSYHDALISLVESNASQIADEFAEVLARAVFPDGSTMLPSLHVKGLLTKFATDQIEMLPNNSTSILLSDLNQLIAEQLGISVQDLGVKRDSKANEEVQELAKVQDISPITGNTEPKMDQTDFTKTSSTSVNAESPVIDPTASPEDTAKVYRSQADKLSKEAAHYRRLAEELMPTKKKSTVKE